MKLVKMVAISVIALVLSLMFALVGCDDGGGDNRVGGGTPCQFLCECCEEHHNPELCSQFAVPPIDPCTSTDQKRCQAVLDFAGKVKCDGTNAEGQWDK